jgi:hypothetical protein
MDFVKRRKKSDKSKEKYERNGKFSQKGIRQKMDILNNIQLRTNTNAENTKSKHK